jgi:hypothetical protein
MLRASLIVVLSIYRQRCWPGETRRRCCDQSFLHRIEINRRFRLADFVGSANLNLSPFKKAIQLCIFFLQLELREASATQTFLI